MKNMILGYIVTIVIAFVIGLPAYIVGEPTVMAIAFFVALFASLFMAFIMTEEDYYED